MDRTRRRTLGLLLAGLLLAVGTPVYLAITRGLEVYLLHPVILVGQAVPYLLAAALWLPWRSRPATSIGQGLAGVLFVTAGLIYVPMLTGYLSTGGDMVGLAFIAIEAVTTLTLLLATAIAYGLLYWHRHHSRR